MPQVLINFDINEDKIAENAEKEAGRKIIDQIFGDGYNRKSTMSIYVKGVVADILEPMKDEIIKEAVNEVVANLHRTKAVKELLNEAASD